MLITISREFWSWWHSIWQAVAKELWIKFYDQEIVTKVAKESWYSKEFIKENWEYIDEISTYFSLSWFLDPKDEIFKIQREIILKLANEDCVIVWRCANFILKNEWIKSFNVFIHSDKEHRAQRILKKYWKTDESIEKRIEKKDKQRKTYVKYYTDEDRWDYHNYHLSLNSWILWEEECIISIINAAKKIFK